MIPEPTDEDFARDADSVYAEAWRLFQLGVGRKEPEALAWIRLAEHYRIGRRALLKREGKALQLIRKLEAERDRLAAENAELRRYIASRSVETFNDSPSMQREKP